MPLQPIHRITVYVPAPQAAAFQRAVLAVDDLAIADYSETVWRMQATEQFRPGPQAQPTVGKAGALSVVESVRLELCIPRDADRLQRLLAAIHGNHPWEVPSVMVDDAWFALP